MNVNWSAIYNTHVSHKAYMVKDILEDNNISAIIVDKTDSFHTHLTLGEISVYVKNEMVMHAKRLISKIEFK